MQFKLIYDPEMQERVEKRLLPKLGDLVSSKKELNHQNAEFISNGDRLLCFLSDEQIKGLLPLLKDKDVVIGILPHPNSTQACIGFGVETKLEKAIEHLKSFKESYAVDILYCNGRPVFNNLVMGYAFRLTTTKAEQSVGFFKRNWELIKRLLNLQPFRFDLKTKKGKELKTAVSGVVVAQHKKSSLFSRIMLDNSYVNDGMMHVFLLSPRSVSELAMFAIRSVWEKKVLPHFGAHIKTDEISFSSPGKPIEYSEDGSMRSFETMELKVEKKHISIVPGRLLELSKGASSSSEVYKVKILPTGEAARELSMQKLPLIRHASTEEFKDLFNILRENAKTKSSYLALMVLSVVLATFGVFADSSPVVIGAMILAPLMAPIISLSMATLRQDRQLALNSIYTILAGLGIAYFFAVIIALITPIHLPNSEIINRTRPNILDLGIAVVSGIAGAYAYAREEVAKTLAGVAIAVALVPPLAVSGIGLGWADWAVFSGAAFLLFTNLAGMVLAASLAFLFLGFSPLRLAAKGVLISLAIVVVLSIPLAFGFNRMLKEHDLIKRLDGWETEKVILKNINVQRLSPLTISVKIVSEEFLEIGEIDHIKAQIEERLGQEVRLEVTTAVNR